MAVLPQMVYRFSATPNTPPADFFIESDKFTLKFILNCKGTRTPKTILEKKSKVEGLTILYFKTYYRATVNKTVWHLQNRYRWMEKN